MHGAGGLLYYDGANLNAILGKVKPGDMGFDVIHMNLHKTFATPHGGGGPGAGPVGVARRLMPFLPLPIVAKEGERFRWLSEDDRPQSIGRMSAFGGNAGVLLRAYVYARMLGRDGMRRVAEFATLNANYLMIQLRKAGFEVAFDSRRASHEFIVTLKGLKEKTGVTAMDVAKRLLDKGFHAPTTYFPLLVPECLLIEPTETESRETLDAFVTAMKEILDEAHSLFVRRLQGGVPARRRVPPGSVARCGSDPAGVVPAGVRNGQVADDRLGGGGADRRAAQLRGGSDGGSGIGRAPSARQACQGHRQRRGPAFPRQRRGGLAAGAFRLILAPNPVPLSHNRHRNVIAVSSRDGKVRCA